MSLRRGLIGFGMSAAIAWGGVEMLNDWQEAVTNRGELVACQAKPATESCAGKIATGDTIKVQRQIGNLYLALGLTAEGLAVLGGAASVATVLLRD